MLLRWGGRKVEPKLLFFPGFKNFLSKQIFIFSKLVLKKNFLNTWEGGYLSQKYIPVKQGSVPYDFARKKDLPSVFQCEHCGDNLKDRKAYTSHVKKHTGFKCVDCSKYFGSQESLTSFFLAGNIPFNQFEYISVLWAI